MNFQNNVLPRKNDISSVKAPLRIYYQVIFISLFILYTTNLLSQCGGGSCEVCGVTATISSINGGTIINGFSEISGNTQAGDQGIANDPLVISVTACGVITLSVDLTFVWDQGSSVNWIHGVSFLDSGGWIAAEGVINPSDPGWIFLDGITGACSGVSYGAGFYWDPPGDACSDSGNLSNYNGSGCQGGPSFCEEDDAWLVDGDPSDNWGIDCTDDCPQFGFDLKYCPSANGDVIEEISFFLTEDGETGAWNNSDGCIFELVFPVVFESAGVQIPEEQTICLGECYTLDAGDGCSDYEWSTGENTQTIEVCPTQTTMYSIEVVGDAGCSLDGETLVIVDFCCDADAGEITANTPVCPGEVISYSITNFNADPGYAQVVFIADANGSIVEIFPDVVGNYSSPFCGNFTIYSYNYLMAGTSPAPTIGMNVSTIDCNVTCCELIPFEVSFEDTEAPTFPNAPTDINFACSSNIPIMEDQVWNDNCAGTGAVPGMELGTLDFCTGGTITRTWEITDNCNNVTIHTQSITIDPPLEAAFIDPPADENVDCTNIPTTFPDLLYSNNMAAPCLIDGGAPPMVTNNFDPICGGTITVEYTFTDVCGRTINHSQTITIDPATEPTFDMLPANMNLPCSAQDVTAMNLLASNNDPNCLIEQTVIPQVTDNADACGGDITIDWEFMDPCGRTISHSQVITIEPAEEAVFIDPPADFDLTCGDPEPEFDDLIYSNGQIGDCLIENSVPASVDTNNDSCGGTITATWEFTDDCGRTITHVQVVTLEPAPEAVFIDLPDDLQMSCTDFENFVPDELSYSNSSAGLCEIVGSVPGVINGFAGLCGGSVDVDFEFTDPCDRTITYTQTITVDPADEAEFINIPNDITLGCNAVNNPLPNLNYTNNGSTDCLISGSVTAFQSGVVDACGGDINYVYTFIDGCGRTINYIQGVTILPASEPDWVDPPFDFALACDEDLPNDLSLQYDNNQQSPCDISGSVEPDIDQNGGLTTLSWTFTNPCSGEEIFHQQEISQSLSVLFDEDDYDFTICVGAEFDLESIDMSDENNTDPDISYHDNFPPDASNEISNTIVSPTDNTTYYILGNNDFDCPDIIEVLIEVELQSSAGSDNSGEICIDAGQMNLFDYLSADADLDGDFYQILGPDINFSEAQSVNISQADPGNYLFEYFIDGNVDCDPDVALIEVDLLPQVEIDVASIECSADFLSYIVNVSNNGYNISFNAGVFFENNDDLVIVGNIPIAQDLILDVVDPDTGCEGQFFFSPPNCDCPSILEPVSNGNEVICVGDPIPVLSVMVSAGTIANWYDAPIGGTLLIGGSTEYTPTVSMPGAYTFYVEAQSIADPACTSATRTPIVLEILSAPEYTTFIVQTCDDDQDGILLWDAMTLQSFININPAESASYYSTMADAESATNELALPFTNTTAFTESIFVVISNAADCSSIVPLTFTIFPKPVLDVTTMDESCNEFGNGSFVITAFDPSSTYIFEDETITSETIGNLATGEYELIQIDAMLCADTSIFEINEGLELSLISFTWDCFDNDTNTDATDDFFEINFVVSNTAGDVGAYNVLDQNNNLLGTFDYADDQQVTLPADGSSQLFSFADVDNGCMLTQMFGPLSPCSSDCIITVEQLELVCDDNDTPNNSDDDIYEVTILATAINGGAQGNYTVAVDGTISFSFEYGVEGSFSLPANSALVTLSIADSEILACSVNEPVGPLTPCSDACFINAEASNIICDDNDTPNDGSDDVFLFDILVTGMNNSGEFVISSLPFQGAYDEVHTLGPFNVNVPFDILIIQDSDDDSCTFDLTVTPPLGCSEECILSATVSNIVCDDNDTSNDGLDDVFFFNLSVSGINNSSGYIIPSIGFDGEYDVEYNFGPFNINDPLPSLFALDADDASCLVEIDVDVPLACSEACVLEAEAINIICDANGTLQDDTDDIFFFQIQVDAINGSAEYTIPGISFTGDYGQVYDLGPFDIQGAFETLLIQDINDANCLVELDISVPASCSDLCTITAIAENIECQDNGTADDNGDDIFFFDLTITGVNVSSAYNIDDIAFSGAYDNINNLGPFNIADGPISLLIEDDENPGCFTEVIVNPPPVCSDCNQTITLSDPSELSCSQPQTSITANASENGSYEWSGPNGFMETTATIFVSVPGIYQVVVSFPDGCGLMDEVEVLSNGEIPIAVLSDTENLTCDITEVLLDASSSTFTNAAAFIWTNEDGDVISNELTVMVEDPGSYFFEIVDSTTGCSSELQEIQVGLVISDPSAVIFADPGNILDCFVETISLSTEGEPFVIYNWILDNENIETDELSIDQAGDISLIALDTITGCFNESNISIIDLSDFPIIIVEELGEFECEGGEVCFDVSISPLSETLDFIWFDENGSEVGDNSPVFCTSIPGDYVVQLTDPNNGCVNSETLSVDDQPIIPSISLPPVSILSINGEVELTVDIDIPMSEVAEIIWSPTDNVSCVDCKTTQVQNGFDGLEITVEVISISGCSATATTELGEITITQIYIPTVFTPESETGNNNFFSLYDNGQVEIIEEMFIFDRWGEMIFNEKNIPTNDPRLGWDGRFKGDYGEQGVYVYMFKVRYVGGEVEIHTGSITLLR